MTNRIALRIQELDCAEEVVQLRDLLGKTPGILELDFDVVNGRVYVTVDSQDMSTDLIIKRIASIGMRASLAADDAANAAASSRHRRASCAGVIGVSLRASRLLLLFSSTRSLKTRWLLCRAGWVRQSTLRHDSPVRCICSVFASACGSLHRKPGRRLSDFEPI